MKMKVKLLIICLLLSSTIFASINLAAPLLPNDLHSSIATNSHLELISNQQYWGS